MITEERPLMQYHTLMPRTSPRTSKKSDQVKNFAKRRGLTIQTSNSSCVKRFATQEPSDTPLASTSHRRLENLNQYDAVLSAIPLNMMEEMRAGASLFIGSIKVAQNLDLLTRAGITHILNCTNESPLPFSSQFTYKSLPLSDQPSEDITSCFREVHTLF